MVEMKRRRQFGRGPLRSAGLVVGLTVLALAACNRPTASERPPERGDVAVARVNGAAVWKSDVNREAVAQGLIGEGEPLDVTSDLFRRVLDEVVDQKLLAAEALKRRLDRDPVAQRRLAAARERILGDMLVEGVVDRAVNENAIKALYQEQLKLSKQSEEIHARQILVANQADGDAVKKLLASGALNLSKPASLLNFVPKRPPAILEAKEDRFVIDLLKFPQLAANPSFQKALRTMTPILAIGDIHTEGDLLVIGLKATPRGLRESFQAFRS